ncbi:MAG: sigma-54-dependent Fis family transcriptional regulator [Acidimicrobiales bacterium]
MAHELSRPATATADMVAARRRSALYGIDPARTQIPHHGDPRPAAESLVQLSSPVLDRLLSQIAGSSLAVVMSDRDGRLTRRDAPLTATLAAMDSRSLDIGFSLAEAEVGTNGVGTSLETRKPAVVVGQDHFLECFHDFTCANAPIVQPVTGRVEGTVGVVCPVDDTGPLLLSTAVQLASQIGELLLERATPEERFLLEQFLLLRRSSKNAIATIGHDVLIATPPAQRHLADLDHVELWGRVESAVSGGQAVDIRLDRSAQSQLVLRCLPLHRGGEIEGAAVHFVTERPSTDRGRRHRTQEHLGGLVGTSQQWHAVVRDALNAAQLDEPVVIVGERGTGRCAVAEAISKHSGRSGVEVFDSSDLVLDAPRGWLTGIAATSSPDATVVLRRIDELPDDVAAGLANVVSRNPACRFIATTQTTASGTPGFARLLRQLDVLRIDIPPLRNRREDIPVLGQHFAGLLGRPKLERQVINTLSRQSWPGNAAELRQAMRSAHAKARTGPMSAQHLPRHLRRDHGRAPLHGLRQQEAEAIVAAINSTTTRAEAAKQLGISRATLYRRIDAYGLDLGD